MGSSGGLSNETELERERDENKEEEEEFDSTNLLYKQDEVDRVLSSQVFVKQRY